MDCESERVFERMQLHRLMEQHTDWTNQHFADVLNKSEGWVRKWRYRFLNTPKGIVKLFAHVRECGMIGI